MPPTILVVDDDVEIVQFLRNALEEEGYKVVTGFDGQMAVALAREHRPNLILLDVNMPMTNGLKALEYIRQQPGLKDTPVLFLTGENTERIYPTVANHARVAYLKKPVDLRDLRSILKQVVGPAH
jgi:two-component system, OmpR family, alkaline phosphatase synthesis response regulator PhoP